MNRVYVVGDYRHTPSEGTQVVVRTLVDGLRARGVLVTVVPPEKLVAWLPRLILRPPRQLVFVHGPGAGVVRASVILRRLTKTHIVWIGTRPDLVGVPVWARGRKAAHDVICNRIRADLQAAAPTAILHEQFIGIDPSRLMSSPAAEDPWPELRRDGRPVALHVGHLRRNRGLDLLIEAKLALSDRLEVVIQGSPTFSPDPGVIEELTDAGVHVRRDYVPNLADLYRAADLYVFPARPELAGAIELPLGVLEALSCGIPVLANDFGALRAALGDSNAVILTSPGRFVADLELAIADAGWLSGASAALPPFLHAERVTEVVLALTSEVTS